MTNDKLWVASVNGTLQPAEGQSPVPGCSADAPPGPQPEEGLRLIRAFSRIGDASRRAQLVDEAEKMARA